MEILFRRHFWVFHAVFLAAVAFLLARGVNTGIGAVLKSKLDSGAVVTDQRPPPPRGRTRNFDAATEQNIFGAKREVVTEQDVANVQSCQSDDDCDNGTCVDGVCEEREDPKNDLASAVPSDLRARLVGTAVFSEAEFSLASIVDETGGKNAEAGLYSVNACEKAPPPPPADAGPVEVPRRAPCNVLMDVAEIKLIDADRVYFYNKSEERYEYLALGEEPKKGPLVSARAPAKQAPSGRPDKTDDLEQHIKKTGDNSFAVEQAGVDKALGDLSSLATQARIVPAFEGGEAVGFKLFSIRPGSLYSKIGIQNGDVISRINGYELNSPDKALEVYQKLKDAKEITVDLKRRGKPTTLNYNIVQ
jgi:general secretion pathway protein C